MIPLNKLPVQAPENLFKEQLLALSKEEGLLNGYLFVKNNGSLEQTLLLNSLTEKFKELLDFKDSTDIHLLELKALQFLKAGRKWIKTPEDIELVKTLVKRLGLPPANQETPSELQKLLHKIYNPKQTLPFEKTPNENHDTPSETDGDDQAASTYHEDSANPQQKKPLVDQENPSEWSPLAKITVAAGILMTGLTAAYFARQGFVGGMMPSLPQQPNTSLSNSNMHISKVMSLLPNKIEWLSPLRPTLNSSGLPPTEKQIGKNPQQLQLNTTKSDLLLLPKYPHNLRIEPQKLQLPTFFAYENISIVSRNTPIVEPEIVFEAVVDTASTTIAEQTISIETFIEAGPAVSQQEIQLSNNIVDPDPQIVAKQDIIKTESAIIAEADEFNTSQSSEPAENLSTENNIDDTETTAQSPLYTFAYSLSDFAVPILAVIGFALTYALKKKNDHDSHHARVNAILAEETEETEKQEDAFVPVVQSLSTLLSTATPSKNAISDEDKSYKPDCIPPALVLTDEEKSFINSFAIPDVLNSTSALPDTSSTSTTTSSSTTTTQRQTEETDAQNKLNAIKDNVQTEAQILLKNTLSKLYDELELSAKSVTKNYVSHGKRPKDTSLNDYMQKLEDFYNFTLSLINNPEGQFLVEWAFEKLLLSSRSRASKFAIACIGKDSDEGKAVVKNAFSLLCDKHPLHALEFALACMQQQDKIYLKVVEEAKQALLACETDEANYEANRLSDKQDNDDFGNKFDINNAAAQLKIALGKSPQLHISLTNSRWQENLEASSLFKSHSETMVENNGSVGSLPENTLSDVDLDNVMNEDANAHLEDNAVDYTKEYEFVKVDAASQRKFYYRFDGLQSIDIKLEPHDSTLDPADRESLKSLARINVNSGLAANNNGHVLNLPKLLKNIYNFKHDSIPLIRLLMQRALVNFWHHPNPTLKNEIEDALKGLKHLRSHYEKNLNTSMIEKIDPIIEFVIKSLAKINAEGFCISKDSNRAKTLLDLEASNINLNCLKVAPKSVLEGVEHYRKRINEFLFFEENFLSSDDCDFLVKIDISLGKAIKNYNYTIKADEVLKRSVAIYNENKQKETDELILTKDLAILGKKDPELWYLSCDNADLELKKDLMLSRLKDMDTQIGLQLPMHFGWWVNKTERQSEGHCFYIGVCKDGEDKYGKPTYTVSQANAGGLCLGDYSSFFSNNMDVVVEFKDVSEENIIKFLIQADQSKNCFFERSQLKDGIWSCPSNTREQADIAYTDLFGLLNVKPVNSDIPTRREQSIGNCVIRSLKESLIYAFQKSNKVDLANKFLTYTISRHLSSYDFDAVKPLNRSAGNVNNNSRNTDQDGSQNGQLMCI